MVLSKRKIGDFVRIKSHEWADNLTWDDRASIPFGFNSDMEEFCGRQAKIVNLWRVDDYLTGYSIDIDGCTWSWNEYMFEEGPYIYGIE